MRVRILIAAVLVFVSGCVTAPYHRMGQEAYTLTDLHPWEEKGKLTSANHIYDGLIPLCSKVVFTDQRRKTVSFRVVDTGRTYTFWLHRQTVEPFLEHLDRYFGDSCDSTEPSRLSPVDQEGIRLGKALEGMSKRGVVLALGYPADHRTPSLDADTWIYWRRRSLLIIHFADDLVTRVAQGE